MSNIISLNVIIVIAHIFVSVGCGQGDGKAVHNPPRPNRVIQNEQDRLLVELTHNENIAVQKTNDRVKVTMFGEGVTDQTLSWLGSLENVSSLTIDGDGLTDDNIHHLKSLNRIDELMLSRNRITDRSIVSSVNINSVLKFDLRLEDLIDGSFLTGTSSPRMESLFFLAIPLKDESFRTLGSYERLKSISISGAPLGDPAIAHIARCKSIETLSITDAMFTDDGIASLARHPNLRFLKAWSRSNRVTDESLHSLSTVQRLTTLSLLNADLTDKGVSYLKSNSMLQNVVFDSNGIGDEGLRHLSDLIGLKSLTIKSRRITGTSLAELCQKCKNIEYLDLSRTQISDEALVEIAKLKSLRTLILIGVQLTEDSLRRFEQQHPEIQVTYQ